MKYADINQLFVAPLLILSLLSACTELPSPEVSPIVVDTEVIPEISSQRERTFPAVVHASDLTQLSFQLNGEVKELLVTEGTEVKKGQLLAKLDDTLLKLSAQEKKARVDLSKVQAERAKQMVDQGNMPKSTYDELYARYEIALADYHYAQRQLEYVELKAPFDGIISDVIIERFQATTLGKPVVIMHKLGTVEIRVDLPDALVASVDDAKVDQEKEQDPILVSIDAYPNDVFYAEYKKHTTEQNDENRSFTLVLEMPSSQAKPILQGMPGSITVDLAKIERDTAYYSVVPLHAVVSLDSNPSSKFTRTVWRLNGDTVEPVEVTVGRIVDTSHIEVIGDIKPGDRVVTKGLQYLKPGLKVNVLDKKV